MGGLSSQETVETPEKNERKPFPLLLYSHLKKSERLTINFAMANVQVYVFPRTNLFLGPV